MKYVRIALQVILMVTAMLAVAACDKSTVSNGNDTSGKVDDAVITAKVKAALFNDDSVKSLNVSVTTNDGVVTLTGMVDSQEQIDLCVALARQVLGVKSVSNRLTLKKVARSVQRAPMALR